MGSNVSQGEAALGFDASGRRTPESELRMAQKRNADGVSLLERRNFYEAATTFQDALRYAPHSVTILANVALSYAKQAKLDIAKEWYLRAHAEDPTDIETVFSLGWIDRKRNDFQSAEAMFLRVCEKDANNKRALFLLGDVLQKQKQFSRALECFEKMPEDNVDAKIKAAKCWAELDQTQKALDILLQLGATCEIQFDLATAYEKNMTPYKALAAYQKAAELFKPAPSHPPFFAEHFYRASQLAVTLEDLSAGSKFCGIAFKIRPRSEPCFAVAKAYQESSSMDWPSKIPVCKMWYQRALSISPKHVPSLLGLVETLICEWYLGEEGTDQLHEFLAKSSNHLKAMANCSTLCFQCGEFARTRTASERMLSLDHALGHAFWILAELLKKEVQESNQKWYLTLNTDPVKVVQKLVASYVEKDDLEEAIIWIDRGLELQPDNKIFRSRKATIIESLHRAKQQPKNTAKRPSKASRRPKTRSIPMIPDNTHNSNRPASTKPMYGRADQAPNIPPGGADLGALNAALETGESYVAMINPPSQQPYPPPSSSHDNLLNTNGAPTKGASTYDNAHNTSLGLRSKNKNTTTLTHGGAVNTLPRTSSSCAPALTGNNLNAGKNDDVDDGDDEPTTVINLGYESEHASLREACRESLRRHEWDQAKKELQTLARDPRWNDEEAKLVLARYALHPPHRTWGQPDADECIQWLDGCTQPDSFFLLAEAYFSQQKFSESITSADRFSIEADQNSLQAETALTMGKIYFYCKKKVKADHWLKLAISVTNHNSLFKNSMFNDDRNDNNNKSEKKDISISPSPYKHHHRHSRVQSQSREPYFLLAGLAEDASQEHWLTQAMGLPFTLEEALPYLKYSFKKAKKNGFLLTLLGLLKDNLRPRTADVWRQALSYCTPSEDAELLCFEQIAEITQCPSDIFKCALALLPRDHKRAIVAFRQSAEGGNAPIEYKLMLASILREETPLESKNLYHAVLEEEPNNAEALVGAAYCATCMNEDTEPYYQRLGLREEEIHALKQLPFATIANSIPMNHHHPSLSVPPTTGSHHQLQAHAQERASRAPAAQPSPSRGCGEGDVDKKKIVDNNAQPRKRDSGHAQTGVLGENPLSSSTGASTTSGTGKVHCQKSSPRPPRPGRDDTKHATGMKSPSPPLCNGGSTPAESSSKKRSSASTSTCNGKKEEKQSKNLRPGAAPSSSRSSGEKKAPARCRMSPARKTEEEPRDTAQQQHAGNNTILVPPVASKQRLNPRNPAPNGGVAHSTSTPHTAQDRIIYIGTEGTSTSSSSVAPFPSAAMMDLESQHTVKWENLTIGCVLGSGGFGTVYYGRYNGLEVAIKKLNIDPCSGLMSTNQRMELEKEIETLKKVRHPRLVTFVGACFTIPNVCIVTEYMSGGSLHQLLHVDKRELSTKDQIRMGLQMLEGLAFLHSMKPPMIHRDLKSLNIVLSHDWNPKICDFGLTQTMEHTHLSVAQAGHGGSPRYMAPELYTAHGKITEKVDVWAMACILIETFGGPLPFNECTLIEQIITCMVHEKRAPTIPSFLDPRLQSVLAKCFIFDVSRRVSVFALAKGMLAFATNL